MARKGEKKPFVGEEDPDGFAVWVRRFLEHMQVRNYSGRTIHGTEAALRIFAEWCTIRDLYRPDQVTKPILEQYQRWLFYYRKPSSGKPLTFSSQRERLQKLKNFFKWMARQNALPSNPASDLELPRIERRLPRAVLSRREIDKVLALPNLTDPLGMRDRTMMEVLYSTGIRRHELGELDLFDVHGDSGTLSVRLGKGKRDRVVPIGERALDWVDRYVEYARPELAVSDAEHALFLTDQGLRFHLGGLSNLMRTYVDRAVLGKTGACHIFRHSMATHMLEGGADIRHIQEILGHAETSTTAIYTRISIRHLKAVHDATHPSAKLNPDPVRTAISGADSRTPAGQLSLFPDLEGSEVAKAAPSVDQCLPFLAAEQRAENEEIEREVAATDNH